MWCSQHFFRAGDIENQLEESQWNCTQDLTRSQRKAHQREVERLKTTLRNEKEKFQTEFQALEKKVAEESRENARLEKEYGDRLRMYQIAEETNSINSQRLEAENQKLERQCQCRETEYRDLDVRYQREIDGWQKRYDDLREKLQTQRKTNEDLSTR